MYKGRGLTHGPGKKRGNKMEMLHERGKKTGKLEIKSYPARLFEGAKERGK